MRVYQIVVYQKPITFSLDDSGRWGKGGLFDALSARSTQPQMCYEQAGKMRDLTLGDAHLIPIDDLQSREQGRDMVSIANINICVVLNDLCYANLAI